MSTFDSRPETHVHIGRVRHFLNRAIAELMHRGERHDASKLDHPEVEAFDEATPKLANLEYGSEEYKRSLEELGPALQHHFAENDHHPEHFGLPEEAFRPTGVDVPVGPGVSGMSAMAIIEMVCDWRAASERTKQRTDGDEYLKASFEEGLRKNHKRFGYSREVASIIHATAEELGFL